MGTCLRLFALSYLRCLQSVLPYFKMACNSIFKFLKRNNVFIEYLKEKKNLFSQKLQLVTINISFLLCAHLPLIYRGTLSPGLLPLVIDFCSPSYPVFHLSLDLPSSVLNLISISLSARADQQEPCIFSWKHSFCILFSLKVAHHLQLEEFTIKCSFTSGDGAITSCQLGQNVLQQGSQ